MLQFKRRQFLKVLPVSVLSFFLKIKEAVAVIPFSFWKSQDSTGTLQVTQLLMVTAGSGVPALRTTQAMLVTVGSGASSVRTTQAMLVVAAK